VLRNILTDVCGRIAILVMVVAHAYHSLFTIRGLLVCLFVSWIACSWIFCLMFVSWIACLFVCLLVCLFVCLLACLFVCLFDSLFVWSIV
jgi:hypothetical protein